MVLFLKDTNRNQIRESSFEILVPTEPIKETLNILNILIVDRKKGASVIHTLPPQMPFLA